MRRTVRFFFFCSFFLCAIRPGYNKEHRQYAVFVLCVHLALLHRPDFSLFTVKLVFWYMSLHRFLNLASTFQWWSVRQRSPAHRSLEKSQRVLKALSRIDGGGTGQERNPIKIDQIVSIRFPICRRPENGGLKFFGCLQCVRVCCSRGRRIRRTRIGN